MRQQASQLAEPLHGFGFKILLRFLLVPSVMDCVTFKCKTEIKLSKPKSLLIRVFHRNNRNQTRTLPQDLPDQFTLQTGLELAM